MHMSPEAERIFAEVAELRSTRARRFERDLELIDTEYDCRIDLIRREYPTSDPMVPAAVAVWRRSKDCCKRWLRRIAK